MPEQQWRYWAAQGNQIHEGIMAAPDAATVRAAIRQSGWELVKLVPVRRGLRWAGPLHSWWQGRQRIKRRMIVADLWDSIQTLLSIGMPLDQALGQMARSLHRSRAERVMLASLEHQVRQGRSLSEACHTHPDWFDLVDCAMIDAGQQGGNLIATMGSLATWRSQSAREGHRLAMALTYPALLLIASLGVVGFISSTILPKLLTILTEAHLSKPMLSVVVMHLGQGMVQYGLVLVVLLFVLFWFARKVWRTLSFNSLPRRLWAMTPLAQTLMRSRLSETAVTLSRLHQSGIPLAEAVEITAKTTSDAELGKVLSKAAEAIRRGERLSTHLAGSNIIDPDFIHAITLGEKSGELGSVLTKLGERASTVASRSIERLTAILEPVAIILLAILVGMVVLAAVLPLVELGKMV